MPVSAVAFACLVLPAAADVADPKVIREMETGQKLTAEAVDSNILSVTTLLPLNQFPSVPQGAPSRIFEQALDE